MLTSLLSATPPNVPRATVPGAGAPGADFAPEFLVCQITPPLSPSSGHTPSFPNTPRPEHSPRPASPQSQSRPPNNSAQSCSHLRVPAISVGSSPTASGPASVSPCSPPRDSLQR